MDISDNLPCRMIDWSALPLQEIPKGTLTKNKLQKLSSAFFGLGGSLGVTTCLTIGLGVSSAFPLLAYAGGLATIATIFTGVMLEKKEPDPLCPSVRLAKRQKLCNQCDQFIPPFCDLLEARRENLLLDHEIQTLLCLDIEQGFEFFKEKHTILAIPFLDNANKKKLKEKYLSYALASNRPLSKIVDCKVGKNLGVSYQEVSKFPLFSLHEEWPLQNQNNL